MHRITNRRITVTGWMGRDRTDITEMSKWSKFPVGLAFGAMVLTLRDGSRLELRAVPKFRHL